MSSPPLLVSPEDSLWETHHKVQQENVQLSVVPDNQGYLAGILTQSSILQACDIRELLLEVERVIIYHFDSDWHGEVIVELVNIPQWSI
jgi:light-regulated signal transduction histidine kinase (bacteriophytochrome)